MDENLHKNHNRKPMSGQLFKLVAQLLTKLDDSIKDWHLASIWGHFPSWQTLSFSPADIATLQAHQVNSVFSYSIPILVAGKTQ